MTFEIMHINHHGTPSTTNMHIKHKSKTYMTLECILLNFSYIKYDYWSHA